jgi:hypothetical protein
MTQRNFFVNHGLECGDIVISATTNTITGLSTLAPSADGDVANKKYVDDQDAAIASDSLVFTNKTFDANGTGNSLSNVEVADFAAGVLDTDLSSVSASDDTLPSAKATKAYVDSATSALVDLDTTITQGNSSVVVADSGTGTITVTADGGTVASFASAATTITASGAINLTAGTDVVIPADVGITFGTGEKIEGDNTDLTVTSGGKINLTAGTDVQIPNNVGVLFGTGGEKIESNGTDLTLTSTGELTLTATGNTVISNDMIINGNLTVNGTETIVNTQQLAIEDAIIGLNRNNSIAATMTRFSGMHIHRGEGSTATELDLYMVWDEQTTASGSTTGLGGVFTFMGSVHQEGSETPNSDFTLADIKASTVEANLTGTATEATNVTITANNTTNETVYLTFVDGATGTQGLETDTGLSYNPSTNVLSTTASQAQYADLAEKYTTDQEYEVGTVMMVNTSESSEVTAAMAGNIAVGVISGAPAYLMNADSEGQAIALKGRVPVKVAGAVSKGQAVYVDDNGVATASNTGSDMVGIALESNGDSGVKLVECILKV